MIDYNIDTYLESLIDDYYEEGFKDTIKTIGHWLLPIESLWKSTNK